MSSPEITPEKAFRDALKFSQRMLGFIGVKLMTWKFQEQDYFRLLELIIKISFKDSDRLFGLLSKYYLYGKDSGVHTQQLHNYYEENGNWEKIAPRIPENFSLLILNVYNIEDNIFKYDFYITRNIEERIKSYPNVITRLIRYVPNLELPELGCSTTLQSINEDEELDFENSVVEQLSEEFNERLEYYGITYPVVETPILPVVYALLVTLEELECANSYPLHFLRYYLLRNGTPGRKYGILVEITNSVMSVLLNPPEEFLTTIISFDSNFEDSYEDLSRSEVACAFYRNKILHS
jgi:hypothetical protein